MLHQSVCGLVFDFVRAVCARVVFKEYQINAVHALVQTRVLFALCRIEHFWQVKVIRRVHQVRVGESNPARFGCIDYNQFDVRASTRGKDQATTPFEIEIKL